MKTKRSKIPLYQSPNRLVSGLSVRVSAITNVIAVSMMARMYGSGRYRLTRRTKNSLTRRIPTSSCPASRVVACESVPAMAKTPFPKNLWHHGKASPLRRHHSGLARHTTTSSLYFCFVGIHPQELRRAGGAVGVHLELEAVPR